MRRLFLAVIALLLLAPAAYAQGCSGLPAINTVCAGAASGSPGFPNFRPMVPADVPTSGVLDNIGSTRGAILERGASGWAIITPGTSGLPWVSNGAGGDPGYQALTGGGIASGTITNSNLANETANTWKGNATGSSAAPADNAWTNCNGNNSAVQYTNGTGTGCGTNFANLTVSDQTVSGGANVTTQTLSTGNVTIDCGARPLQSITNGGAFTITAPSNDGSCIVKSTNNASAGTITFSGFSVGSNTGDALDTTNGHIFSLFIWRVGGTSGYRVAAHQ